MALRFVAFAKRKYFFVQQNLQLTANFAIKQKEFLWSGTIFFSTRVGSGLLTNLNQPGSAKVSEREPKRQLLASAEFSITKLDSFVVKDVLEYTCMHVYLKLKTRPRLSPVSLSLCMN
jgi:hypothetical protein